MDARCRVELLGGLRVQQGERTITRFRTQKTAALLAYLAYHLDRAHPREVLAELLWPWASPTAGRESLSTALASLRRQIEPPGLPKGAVLKTDRFSIQLNPQTVSTDVAEFQAALQAAEQAGNETERVQALTDAVGLYRGPLLPGYYQDWVLPEQDRTAELYLQAVLRLTKALEKAGELEQASDWARRAIAADPLREEAHKELMRLLIVARQPEAALKQYHELARLLRDELDAEPSEDIQRLAERLEAVKGQAPIARAEPARATPQPRGRKALPTGTVTFLLTDIEGSTRLSEVAGEAFDDALTAHHKLLRQQFRQHGGHEVKELGDGFLVAFEHPTTALACAVASQRELVQKRWPKAIGALPVRMAVHTGQVELLEREYRGLALHHASRVLTAGHGGQVLCSEGAAGLLRRDLAAGVRLVDLGVYQLRDVEVPERLFQVSYPGMDPEQFPPLKAHMGYGSHLPLSFTRFFGREKELAWLQDALVQPETRLVTMTGPGGSGKTRLALEAARQLLQPFGGAVWFVPLQELLSAGLVPGAIADALHLTRSPQAEPLEQVVEALSRQPSLLLLDNFEHLAEEGPLVLRTLLERVPALTCLLTSRQYLGLTGEVEFFVAPLPTPRGEGTPEGLMHCESVQLFVDRAQAARPDFQVTPANARAVADLCNRLEGIPLALELAGARAQVLTPAQMLGQLEHRFEFLVSRKRDVPDRHRTLRAAVDWSYQSLSPELQRLYRRLSVFRGGWTVEAAAAVCEEPNALECLEQLRECSLVLLDEGAEETGEVRFGLLETLREYGDGQLAAEERAALDQRHAECYLELAETAGPQLYGPQQKEWLDRLEREHDNMRAALDYVGSAPGEDEAGLRLGVALTPFWEVRGHQTEGRRHLAAALARADKAAATVERAQALVGAGRLAVQQGDTVSARALVEAGLALSAEVGDKASLARGLRSLSSVAEEEGDSAGMRTLAERAQALYHELRDDEGVASCICQRAAVASDEGDHQAAAALLEEALALSRRSGDKRGVMVCLAQQSGAAFRGGDLVGTRTLAEEALAIGRELGDRRSTAGLLARLGMVSMKRADHAAARVLLEEALATHRELGAEGFVASDLQYLAELACDEGDAAAARRIWVESLEISERAGAQRDVAECLAWLGYLAGREGHYGEARERLEAALAVQRQVGDRRGMADSLDLLGCNACDEGDYSSARTLLAESLAIYLDLRYDWGLSGCLGSMARLWGAQGRSREATRLLGAAEALREAIDWPLDATEREEHERALDALREVLGEEDLGAARAEGRAMNRPEAVAYALGAEGTPEAPAP